MHSIVTEIEKARVALQLPETSLRLLAEPEAEAIFVRAEAHFVASTGRAWWWEDFRERGLSHHCGGGDGFLFLSQIVPAPHEVVWWIVESSGSRPSYRVYEGAVETIQRVIGECHGFEYTLIAQDLRWLLCENHSDVLIAIGAEVEANLSTLFY